MLRELVKIANELDNRGLAKEADLLDVLIIKKANENIFEVDSSGINDKIQEIKAESRSVMAGDDDSELVEYVQKLLIDAGQSLPRFGIDGQFGKETENAIKSFEESKGLPPNLYPPT